MGGEAGKLPKNSTTQKMGNDIFRNFGFETSEIEEGGSKFGILNHLSFFLEWNAERIGDCLDFFYFAAKKPSREKWSEIFPPGRAVALFQALFFAKKAKTFGVINCGLVECQMESFLFSPNFPLKQFSFVVDPRLHRREADDEPSVKANLLYAQPCPSF